MSHSVHDAPEKSNPVAWTIGLLVIIALLVAWFARWFDSGKAEGRELGPLPKAQAPVGEPDHKALIANKSQEVIDRGAQVYAQNCASCHGPNGDTNPLGSNPPPRNYHTDVFKAPNGVGPYGLYLTVSNGLPGTGMMGMPTIKPEDRYAVVHFIRESWIKKNNPSQYKDDPVDVVAKIPPPGGGSGEPQIPPALRPIPDEVRVHPLMAGIAADADGKMSVARRWLALAQSGGERTREEAELSKLDGSEDLIALYEASREKNRDRFVNTLINGGSGRFYPYFNLLGEREMNALFEQCAAAAAKSQGVK